MMKYTVLSEFADLQDEKHVYGIGDVYPREGYTPTAERVDELCTGKNLLHKPLIQKVEDEVLPHEVEETPEVEEVVETPETEEQQPEEIAEETEAEEEVVEEEQPKRRRKKNTDD